MIFVIELTDNFFYLKQLYLINMLRGDKCMQYSRKFIKLSLGFTTASIIFFSGSMNCHAGQQLLPFKGSFSGSVAFTSNTSAALSGSGLISHGGASANVGAVQIVGPSSCTNGFAVINQETITTANGDIINIKITDESCPVSPGVYEGKGTYEIMGGTGRFLNASGAGNFNGMGDFNIGKFVFNLDGTIKY